jgi:RecJ-like exonuclease
MFSRAMKDASKISDLLMRQEEIHIVTHIDADGIAAGTIAKKSLDREGIENTIRFVKQLDEDTIEEIKDTGKMTWFTDLGSGIISKLDGVDYVITDHHMPDIDGGKRIHNWRHFNPHTYGIDGSKSISGAGLAYMISISMNRENRDMADLAMVGASGDLQDAALCRFFGWNRKIIDIGKKEGVLGTMVDLRMFGRHTRPLYKLLQYSDDPFFPGLSGRESACISFLKSLGISDGGREKRWIELSPDDRKRVTSALVKLLISKGFGSAFSSRLVGEVCELKREKVGTELRDVKEYATLLNSTARYGYAEVGMRICMGDREEYLKKANDLLKNHRRHIVNGIQFVKKEGVQEYGMLQYFNAGDHIRDTVVGIIAGIILHSREAKNDNPIVVFADKDGREVKASARTTAPLVSRGVDLSKAMQKAAYQLGGTGGGHEMAAGATIPRGTEDEFLKMLDKEIRNQLT